jgi:calcineurin-like phosphoesterase family protein
MTSAPLHIVAISDTHGLHDGLVVPDGDILIHAGDLTMNGDEDDVIAANEFLGTLPHPDKIVIAGNHDFCFERDPKHCSRLLTNAIYLQDSAVVVRGLKVYGSPWQPWFCDWAFNLRRGQPLREKWDLIPSDTDVLITHGPPQGIHDYTSDGEHAGCADLLAAVTRIQPRLHVFGHIHEGWGQCTSQHTTFINASICNLEYRPVNSAIVSDYR